MVVDIAKVTSGLRLNERVKEVASAGVAPSLRLSERSIPNLLDFEPDVEDWLTQLSGTVEKYQIRP